MAVQRFYVADTAPDALEAAKRLSEYASRDPRAAPRGTFTQHIFKPENYIFNLFFKM